MGNVTVLENIRQFLEEHCGLVCTPERNPYLHTRIKRRMQALALTQLEEYQALLRTDTTELNQLISLLTINETFFYRHPVHFLMLEDYLKKHQPQPFFIWSAGCSLGAEPYSIAILVRKVLASAADSVTLLATDIDANIIKQAQCATFSKRCVTTKLPDEYQQRYFRQQDNDQYLLDDTLREMVTFRCHNLLRDTFPNGIDIIFCRNVLLYFNPTVKRRIIENFYTALRQDGCLFLSPVENLSSFPYFFAEISGPEGVKGYRKWSTTQFGFGSSDHHLTTTGQLTADQEAIRISGSFGTKTGIRQLAANLEATLSSWRGDATSIHIDITHLTGITNSGLAKIYNCLHRFCASGKTTFVFQTRNSTMAAMLEMAGFKKFAIINTPTAPSANSARTRQAAAAVIPGAARTAKPERKVITIEKSVDNKAATEYEEMFCQLIRDHPQPLVNLHIDMTQTAYLDKAFLLALKRFVGSWPSRDSLSIHCSAPVKLWLQRYKVPQRFITLAEPTTQQRALG